LQDTDYFPPQEFVHQPADFPRDAVADYLRDADVYEIYRGTSWCRFVCKHEMGNRELTDGFWVWPEDLGHYVRDHCVMLPSEFVQHIRANIPRIPAPPPALQQVDNTFWKMWCRQNSDGSYQPRILRAKVQAEREVEEITAMRARKKESDEGVSTVRCQWIGCGNFALRRRALCARCCLRGQEPREVFYFGLQAVLRHAT
jgi:hypothetical protein